MSVHTILFDIDGTILSTGGAGMNAISNAMKEMFGIDRLPKLEVHGRTDFGIFQDLFDHFSIDFDQFFGPLSNRYWELLPDSLNQRSGNVLPGVQPLLDSLSARSDVRLGLLTGNARRAAEIKLNRFELANYFEFGGFGDHHRCRNEVARLAVDAAETVMGDQFFRDKVWVIGDTVHDINCARAVGAKVVSVATGGVDALVLRQENPDYHFDSFEDSLAEVLALFDENHR